MSESQRESKRTHKPKEALPPKDKSISIPEMETIIPEEVKPIFKKLDQREQKTLLVALSVRKWSAPIPPPETLIGYNDAIPDGAERIFRMVEKQSDHRMELEKTVIGTELKQSGRGQNYALIIVILVLIASFALIYLGHDTAGTVLGSVDLVALASVFIIGKYAQQKELKDKQ